MTEPLSNLQKQLLLNKSIDFSAAVTQCRLRMAGVTVEMGIPARPPAKHKYLSQVIKAAAGF